MADRGGGGGGEKCGRKGGWQRRGNEQEKGTVEPSHDGHQKVFQRTEVKHSFTITSSFALPSCVFYAWGNEWWDEEELKRDEVKERSKTEEGRKRQIKSSCLLIKQPRGEALSPSVKAELRGWHRAADPTQPTVASAQGPSQSKDTWIKWERGGSAPAKPTRLRRPGRQVGKRAGVRHIPPKSVETEGGLRLRPWLPGWQDTGSVTRHRLSRWVHQEECGFIGYCAGSAQENKVQLAHRPWYVSAPKNPRPELSVALLFPLEQLCPSLNGQPDSLLAQQPEGTWWQGCEVASAAYRRVIGGRRSVTALDFTHNPHLRPYGREALTAAVLRGPRYDNVLCLSISSLAETQRL